ncbi:MAG: transketolase C-terminal domain-containing protein [Candidatus Wallbacteria bacterium]
MRNTFINCLIELAEKDERIFLVTADLGFSVVEKYSEKFPDRFLNVGIAEQNAAGVSAGLALSGKIVYYYSIIPFVTMRCFEQVRNDIAYMNVNVRLIGVGAGYSYGPAGNSHHAMEDIAIMRAIPGMTVCCPGDIYELRELLIQSVNHNGPMYIRLGKGGEPQIYDSEVSSVNIGKISILNDGDNMVLITISNMLPVCKKIIDEYSQVGIKIALISVHTIKPIDLELKNILKKYKFIFTIEEHNIIGGLGSAIAEIIAENFDEHPVVFRRIGIKDFYTHDVGGQEYLRKLAGIDMLSIKSFINNFIEKSMK